MDEEPPVSSFEGGEEVRAQLREALSAKLAGSLHWELVPEQPLGPPSRKPSGNASPATGEYGAAGNGDDDAETDEEEPPEEFAFRLFGSSNAAAKVTLEKDRPFKPGQGGILVRRPPAYYLARPSQRLREEYASALVTWEQITEKSRQRFWGLERPWRTIPGTAVSEERPARCGKEAPKAAVEGREQESRGRKRLGKKTRIVRRKRDRAAAAEREAADKIRAEKEEHLKAKKKRLNQVKKVRARAKAKAQKAAARSAVGGGGDGGNDGPGADESLPAADGTAAGTTADVSMGGT